MVKPSTEKYHSCRTCKSSEKNFRLYIRTRELESTILHTFNQKKRGFEAIGWYCKKCMRFETDDMVARRRNEEIKSIRKALYGIPDPPGRIAV